MTPLICDWNNTVPELADSAGFWLLLVAGRVIPARTEPVMPRDGGGTRALPDLFYCIETLGETCGDGGGTRPRVRGTAANLPFPTDAMGPFGQKPVHRGQDVLQDGRLIGDSFVGAV